MPVWTPGWSNPWIMASSAATWSWPRTPPPPWPWPRPPTSSICTITSTSPRPRFRPSISPPWPDAARPWCGSSTAPRPWWPAPWASPPRRFWPIPCPPWSSPSIPSGSTRAPWSCPTSCPRTNRTTGRPTRPRTWTSFSATPRPSGPSRTAGTPRPRPKSGPCWTGWPGSAASRPTWPRAFPWPRPWPANAARASSSTIWPAAATT